MHFVDRKAKYPNRWTLQHANGTSEIIELIRNDEPIVPGTPMNAETLNTLSDVAGADIAKEAAESAAAKALESKKAAKDSEDASKKSETNSKQSEHNAAQSEANAAKSEAAAKAAADRAAAIVSTDKTLSIDGAPADAKATGDAFDAIMLMLVTGQLTFGLYTSTGDVLCASTGDTLIATKQIGG